MAQVSKRLLLTKWTKGARHLYGKMGVYTVYSKEHQCLYVGKSIDLGKRVLRFFKPRRKRCLAPSICFKGTTYKDFYIEVTTILNGYKLDAFERTMIAIKNPLYNILLNYRVFTRNNIKQGGSHDGRTGTQKV